MNKKNFTLKLINCMVIVAAILYYNQILELNTALAAANTQIKQLSATQKTTDQPEDLGKYKDGTYQGTATGYGGPVTVQVSIQNGRISEIDITSAPNEDAAYYNMALTILDRIVEQQDSDVDVVTGATYTSNGIIDGAKDALSQAVKK